MEKRFILFLLFTFVLLATYGGLKMMFAPPVPVAEAPDEATQSGPSGEPEAGGAAAGGDGAEIGGGPDASATPRGDGAPAEGSPADGTPEETGGPPGQPGGGDRAASGETVAEGGGAGEQGSAGADGFAAAGPAPRVTLGSMDPAKGYRALVTLNARGAALERVELTSRNEAGRLRYRNLEHRHGYLGNLALSNEGEGLGCRVNVVGPGTPAALAKPRAKEPSGADDEWAVADDEWAVADDEWAVADDEWGLRPGDLIQQFEGVRVRNVAEFELQLDVTAPDQTVELGVLREVDGTPVPLQFTVLLSEQPLELIKPEQSWSEPYAAHPLSLLMSIAGIGERVWLDPDDEPRALRALREANWESTASSDLSTVEFRLRLEPEVLAGTGLEGRWEFVKRYRIDPVPEEFRNDPDYRGYHVDLEIEIHNLSSQPQTLSYRLSGPNGLPLEGWWYSTKIHGGSSSSIFSGMFKSAGARDVLWRPKGYSKMLMKSSSEIHSQAVKNPESPATPLLNVQNPSPLQCIGVDAQYFASMLVPPLDPEATGDAKLLEFQNAQAVALGNPDQKDGKFVRTTNVSVQLTSFRETIGDEPLRQRFVLFVGPKRSELLDHYGLSGAIEYGWFGPVARPLSFVLHLFYQLVGNYGIAIVLLTVLVRGAMFPISRKAARNAQKMQELAPELKKIADKYKNDMEKRGQAQKELFARHNYNPAGGCLLMFLQLPVFIGLYRCLSVDIELRQAPLIPGISWASNLAGPDMLLRWDTMLPDWIAGETGWLGPYLNILPIATIGLFMVQQKLFTPPATDEQSRMQQQVMKFMMVFMGVLFFKVPAGLCLYFIASSIWGICERLLLPKTTPAPAGGVASGKEISQAAAAKPAGNRAESKPAGNGAARAAAKRRQRKR